MKIVQLISSTGFFGAEKVILHLAKGLQGKGHEVSLILLHEPQRLNKEFCLQAEEYNINVRRISCRGRFSWEAVKELRKQFTEEHIEIIHTHGYKADFYGLLARRGLPAKLIATCHNWPGKSLKMQAYKLIDKFVLRKFNFVVTVNDIIKTELLSANIDRQKIRTVFNGINALEFAGETEGNHQDLRNQLGIGQDNLVIGFVGRLAPEKGIDALINAVNTISNAQLLIVGEGPDRKKLEKMAGGLKEKNKIIFAGQRDDITRIMSLLDIFVLPSYNEGLPVVLLEAMAAGKPVIASRIGAIPEVIENGQEGILVKPGDIGAISKAIEHLLAHKEEAQAMGRKALQKVRQQFTVENMTGEYLNVYTGAK